ncbi:hypothetical protein PHLGIDRAFT_499111 [Phlebiopsis gigantea 11061_1 CR5-6]|uniref:Uncharacterized protein n=1 Tax=Phlebiopsis gigantea (strain 11061_1 CR5-6) TaxID=745531 RepID=A0A0C3S3N5_PHLG1|nr:hypothetical protein PHLGIDRAFT_499111 [Phlebiopsis gigantea 11061_1 CR5-6]
MAHRACGFGAAEICAILTYPTCQYSYANKGTRGFCNAQQMSYMVLVNGSSSGPTPHWPEDGHRITPVQRLLAGRLDLHANGVRDCLRKHVSYCTRKSFGRLYAQDDTTRWARAVRKRTTPLLIFAAHRGSPLTVSTSVQPSIVFAASAISLLRIAVEVRQVPPCVTFAHEEGSHRLLTAGNIANRERSNQKHTCIQLTAETGHSPWTKTFFCHLAHRIWSPRSNTRSCGISETQHADAVRSEDI